jgi:L-fucose isomerase
VIRLGLLSFSDGRDRVHESLAPEIRKHEARIKRILEATGEIELVVADEIVHSAETARQQVRQLAAHYLDGMILNIAVFAFPNFVVLAAQEGPGPYLLLGPHDSRYPGLTGLLAAGGALNQSGIQHERLWIDLEDERLPQEALVFGRAASAATRLRGQVYGLVGGRSIGMSTGAAPAELWQRIFGVDVDHVDQSEIIRLAPQVSPAEVNLARQWLEKNVAEIVYDGAQLTPQKFDFQIRCYIALQEIVSTYQFDFVGLKCHFDMSEFFSVQCLSAAFLNDPYDWRGPKKPVALACEADSDGALTMQILSLVSDKPACLLDLRYFDPEKNVYVMPNCGAVPTWFAARSDDPHDNLAKVRIVPSIRKYAGGGAHVEFVFAPGKLTLARLTRSPDGYRMIIMKGEARNYPLGEVVGANPNWPHAFVRLDQSPAQLVQKLQANHVHAVAGDYQKELMSLCRILKIQPVVLDS